MPNVIWLIQQREPHDAHILLLGLHDLLLRGSLDSLPSSLAVDAIALVRMRSAWIWDDVGS